MKKVVIIGAGPAGLTAGYELLKEKKEEYEVIILELDKQVGGISKTVHYKGNRMDIGGHRFFSKNEKVMEFWKELMPLQGGPAWDDAKLDRKKSFNENGPNPEKEDSVMLVRDRVSRIYYLGKFFDYPVSLKWQTFKNMGLIRTIKAGFSYVKSAFIKKKEDSLENFYINRFGKKLYSMFFEKYTEKVWGRHPSEIAADWGAQRVKGLSIIAILKDMFAKSFGRKNEENTETSLIEQFWYPKYGPGQLWETLAEKFESLGGKILFHHEVQKINVDGNIVQSVECVVDGKIEVFQADILISSMPLKDLVEAMKEVNIPEDIRKISIGLPYRDFMTVGLLLKSLNLKNETKIKTWNNMIPDCWIYVQEPGVRLR